MIFWIFAGIDSPRVFVVFNTIALMIPSRCFYTIDAERIIGSILQVFVQPIHSFHARAVRSIEWISCANSNLLNRFLFWGF